MNESVRHFVNTMIDRAEDIASFECGRPDVETRDRLERLLENLKGELVPVVGPELAGRMADAFGATVMGAKHERETLAAMNLL